MGIWQVEECCYRSNKRLKCKADANNQNETKSPGNKGIGNIQVGRGWKSSDWMKHAQTPDLRNSASRLRLRHYIEILRTIFSDSLRATIDLLYLEMN